MFPLPPYTYGSVATLGGFTPASLSGLVAWLKADVGTGGVADADPVVTWTDQSVGANSPTQATGAKQPLYKTNILNGKPVVRFDGTNDFLLKSTFSGGSLTQPYSVALVFRQRSAGAATNVGIEDGAERMAVFSTSTSSRVSDVKGSAGTQLAIKSSDYDWHILRIIFNGASSTVRLDNKPDQTLGSVGSGAMNGLCLGGDFPGGSNAPWDIVEVVVTSDAISTANDNSLFTYFNRRYGILTTADAYKAIDASNNYNAFPGAAIAANGDILVTYRRGAGHQGDRGSIYLSRSTDSGVTWGTPTQILTDATYDLRDPVGLTKLASGTLMQPYFKLGVGGSLTYGSRIAVSTDNGSTWPTTRTIAAPTGGGAANLVKASAQSFSVASNSNIQAGDIDWWFCCWLNAASLTFGDEGIAGKWDGSTDEWAFYEGNGVLVLNNDTGTVTKAWPSTGTWVFVLGYYDSVNNVLALSYDGGADSTSSVASSGAAGNSALRIGRYYSGGTSFDGKIDGFMYGKNPVGGIAGLVSAMKAAMYNSGRGVLYSDLTSQQKSDWGLVAAYEYDSSDLTIDSHGSNTLTAINTPTRVRGVVGNATDSANFAVWGSIVERTSDLIVPAYAINSITTYLDSLLLRSTDGGITWSLQGVIAAGTASLAFTETAVITTTDNDHLLAVVRDDNGQNLYTTTSANGGITWSAPSLLCNGVAPRLLRLADTTLILTWADRNVGPFGVSAMKSSNNGATWSAWRYRLWCRNSGQDMGYSAPVEVSSGVVGCVSYLDSSGSQSSIRWDTVRAASLQ